MTPTERAEKICSLIICNWKPDGNDDRLKLIAAQIEEAQMEAEEKVIKAGGIIAKQVYDKGYAEGFRAARDKAKGICKNWPNQCLNCADEIAQRIAELEP